MRDDGVRVGWYIGWCMKCECTRPMELLQRCRKDFLIETTHRVVSNLYNNL